jgi:hypothetical protein
VVPVPIAGFSFCTGERPRRQSHRRGDWDRRESVRHVFCRTDSLTSHQSAEHLLSPADGLEGGRLPIQAKFPRLVGVRHQSVIGIERIFTPLHAGALVPLLPPRVFDTRHPVGLVGFTRGVRGPHTVELFGVQNFFSHMVPPILGRLRIRVWSGRKRFRCAVGGRG